MALAISILALAISVYALIVAKKKDKSKLKYIYTDKGGLVFFDESGKEIVIHGESIK